MNRVYGGSDDDVAECVIGTADGCLVFTGVQPPPTPTERDSGDVPKIHDSEDFAGVWLVKVNPSKDNRGNIGQRADAGFDWSEAGKILLSKMGGFFMSVIGREEQGPGAQEIFMEK